jgi:nitrous oxide reductase accessory protein NosL
MKLPLLTPVLACIVLAGCTKSDKEPKPTPAPTLPVGVYQVKK